MFFKCPIYTVFIDETKIDPSFRDAQFHIDGYQLPPFRRDQNKKDGGKTVFVREGIIANRMKELDGKTSGIICIELIFSKKICTFNSRLNWNVSIWINCMEDILITYFFLSVMLVMLVVLCVTCSC